jgi:hypothetical protein
MELILFGIGFIAFLAFVIAKTNKRNPRFAGQRVMNKGILIFGVGWFILVVEATIKTDFIVFRYLGYVVAIIGFSIAGFGWLKYVGQMFKPLSEDDIKRMVDPGYDIPYTKCPHCGKVEVRVYGSKTKCPKCGGVIRPEEKSQA